MCGDARPCHPPLEAPARLYVVPIPTPAKGGEAGGIVCAVVGAVVGAVWPSRRAGDV